MLDRSRIQGFGSDSLNGNEEKPGFLSSLGGPAVKSAIDNVSLTFGDAVEDIKEEMGQPWTPLQDLTEMAQEIKSFVTGAVGIEQTADVKEADDEPSQKISPRQRTEAFVLISKFSQGYKPARVAPTAAELGTLLAKCSKLQPSAVASVLYDALCFNDGDFEWQPRLRILHFLEVLYWKGGACQEIAVGVHGHAEDLLKHLASEVLQTKEKGREVLDTLSGSIAESPSFMKDVEAAEEQAAPSEAKATTDSSKASSETALPKSALKATSKATTPAQDLLDMSPACASSASTAPAPAKAAPAAAAAPVDLLGGDSVPVANSNAPPVVDLISMMNVKSPTAAASSAPSASSTLADDGFDPNRPAGSHSSSLSGLDFLSSSNGSGASASSSAVDRHCRNCGAAFPDNISKFCGQCGARRQVPEAPRAMPSLTGSIGGGGYGALGMMSSSPSLGGPRPPNPGAMAALPPGGSGPRPTGPGAMGAAPTAGSPMGGRGPSFPTPQEFQSIPSLSGPADPFKFAEDIMQDFTAGGK